MARQRIRVEGVDAWSSAAIAVAAGVGAAAAGVSPTGSTPVDAVLVTVLAAAAVWCAASAPWWAGVVAAMVGTVFAPQVWLIALGAAAVVAGLAIGVARRTMPWSRAVVAGVSVQVLSRLGDVGALGVSAAIAIVTLTTLALVGVRRRPRRERRVVWIASAGAGLFVGVALLGFGVSAASARPELEKGVRTARAAIDQLAAGEFDAAGASFDQASGLFARAGGDLGKPWAQPVRLVPVVAQHRQVADELTDAAAMVSAEVASSIELIDVDALRVRDGRIDIEAIEALGAPLETLRASLDDLEQTLRGVQSPWLIGRLATELDELAGDIADQRVKGDNVVEAVRLAPALLGAEDVRRYFIAFTTPVEARGLGGLMGNFAEITIDQGRIAVTDFGRHTELNGRAEDRMLVTGPADFLEMWGPLGFVEPDGFARRGIWSDITTSAHFPSVAQVITELYPQVGGRDLDGVFVMDVYALGALMQITGSVDIPGTGVTVTPENAVDFMLRQQYLSFQELPDRVDALEVVASTTVERLLTSELPSPPDLAELMSPYVRERRLLAWSTSPEEQALWRALRMDGGVPDPQGGDSVGVVFNNAGNNKIDLFLEGSAEYRLYTDVAGQRVEGELTVTVRNDAPAVGLPDWVIGNLVGRPVGVNWSYVTLYSVLPASKVTIDGVQVGTRDSSEAGYYTTSFFIDLASEQQSEVVVTMGASVPDPVSFVDRITWRSAPTVTPMPATLWVDDVQVGTVDDAGVTVIDGSPG